MSKSDSRQGVNPQVGVIADSTLQRHVVCKTIESVGYTVAVSLPPEKADDQVVSDCSADVWLVDIEDEDQWSDFIVHLFESAQVPILLGEGNAPSVNSLQFHRWERKIYSKLKDIVGGPKAMLGEDLLGLQGATGEQALLEVEQDYDDQYIPGEPASNIWVLGASLGGPAAVKEFLQALPPGLPIAFVIAQHIDPGFEITLSQVWGRNSHFKFIQPRPGRVISHGQIVIAPLEQVMTANQFAQLVFFEQAWEGPYSPSIDQVMSLMADHLGVQTGAILFSGMGNDGAIAAVKMHELGIQVWAQSAETCANSSMPDSARATGCVGFNGSPPQLAQNLIQYIAKQYDDALLN